MQYTQGLLQFRMAKGNNWRHNKEPHQVLACLDGLFENENIKVARTNLPKMHRKYTTPTIHTAITGRQTLDWFHAQISIELCTPNFPTLVGDYV